MQVDLWVQVKVLMAPFSLVRLSQKLHLAENPELEDVSTA